VSARYEVISRMIVSDQALVKDQLCSRDCNYQTSLFVGVLLLHMDIDIID
jgi:hypothetical protein